MMTIAFSYFAFSTIQLKLNGCISYNKKILFAVQIDKKKKKKKKKKIYKFKCIPLNPFKSFSYLVSLNKYHCHSGLVFIFLKTTGPLNVPDMITAFNKIFVFNKEKVYFAVKVHNVLIVHDILFYI